ncbi:MAG: MFS transporter [Cyanobacteria bacterium P01_A01_bin.17]
MKIFWTLAPRVRRSLVVLLISGFCFWASLGSQLPTLPLYIGDLGATEQQLGVVMGAFALGLLGSRAWLGRMADQRSRKVVLQIGLMVAAIAPLLYLGVKTLPILFAVRAFHGVSLAAFTTAYTALVVDLSPREQRGELIGYMSLINPIGVMLGPTVGGLLQAWAGYLPLFLLASGLAIFGLLAASTIDEGLAQGESKPQVSKKQKFWGLLQAPRLKIPATVMLLIGLTFGTLSTFVPLLIRETAVDLNAGLFYSVAAIASFVIRVLTGKASDRLGRGRFISMSLGCYGLAMILLWLAHTELTFLLAGIFQGCGSGTLIPMIAALMADRSEPHERARVLSLCISGFDVGIALAGPCLGTVATLVGIRPMFGLACGFAGVALLLFATSNSKDFSHSIAFALGNGRDIYALDSVAPNVAQ